MLFGVGFVVAATVALAGGERTLYLGGVIVGFLGLGLGVVGFFLNRGTVPLPDAPIWSPTGLRALARALGWPATGVMVVVYGLIGFGVIGNIVIPIITR